MDSAAASPPAGTCYDLSAKEGLKELQTARLHRRRRAPATRLVLSMRRLFQNNIVRVECDRDRGPRAVNDGDEPDIAAPATRTRCVRRLRFCFERLEATAHDELQHLGARDPSEPCGGAIAFLSARPPSVAQVCHTCGTRRSFSQNVVDGRST